MSGFRSIRIVLAAAAACVAMAVVDVFHGAARCYSAGIAWLSRGFDFLVAKIEPAKPDASWLTAWHRVAAKLGMQPNMVSEKRRPLMSTRWRMCPSC